jgi:hypothetical protein
MILAAVIILIVIAIGTIAFLRWPPIIATLLVAAALAAYSYWYAPTLPASSRSGLCF